jgi:predicted alpha/beta-fold hydrolase
VWLSTIVEVTLSILVMQGLCHLSVLSGPGVPLTSPQLYSACRTDDLRQALLYITHCYPRAPLLGLGFSLGANILTRYVAEEGEECRLVSACALACVCLSPFGYGHVIKKPFQPWNLTANIDACVHRCYAPSPAHAPCSLHGQWFRRNFYAKGMGRNIRQLVSRHVDSIMKFPDSRLARCLPELFSHKSLTLKQFDDLVTVHAGGTTPPFPFESARDYYAHASSHKVLGDVRIPFLAVNADDDPVVKHVPEYETDNGWVVLVVTRGGGHLGWFETMGKVKTRTWISRPVLEWFRATAEKIDMPRHRVTRNIWVVDGWLVESGREHLGCRESSVGGG